MKLLLITTQPMRYSGVFSVVSPTVAQALHRLQQRSYDAVILDDTQDAHAMADAVQLLGEKTTLVHYGMREAPGVAYHFSPSAYTPEQLLREVEVIGEKLSGKASGPRKVLIIEDNAEISMMYRLAFEQSGVEVSTAANGIEGITQAIAVKPDCILLDIMMPQMDGFETLTALKQNSSHQCRIYICSNLELQEDMEKALRLGADKFLRKSDYTPFEVVELIMQGR
ncbi:response regulator [Candidatus Peribacteria bacterium]|nr:response regulator [Candidatus Peribacteria bacterium]